MSDINAIGSLQELITNTIFQTLAKIPDIYPAVIAEIDLTKYTCVAQPLVKMFTLTGEYVDRQKVECVIERFGTNGVGIELNLAVGAFGFVKYFPRSIKDNVLNKTNVIPQDTSVQEGTFAIFFPNSYKSETGDGQLKIVAGSQSITIDKNGINMSPDVTIGGKSFINHFHTLNSVAQGGNPLTAGQPVIASGVAKTEKTTTPQV